MEVLEKELTDLCEELFIKKMESFNFEPKQRYHYQCNIDGNHWCLQVDFSHLPPYELIYNLAIHKVDNTIQKDKNYYGNYCYYRSLEEFVSGLDIFCNKLKLHRVNEQILKSCKMESYRHLIKKVKNKLRRIK